MHKLPSRLVADWYDSDKAPTAPDNLFINELVKLIQTNTSDLQRVVGIQLSPDDKLRLWHLLSRFNETDQRIARNEGIDKLITSIIGLPLTYGAETKAIIIPHRPDAK